MPRRFLPLWPAKSGVGQVIAHVLCFLTGVVGLVQAKPELALAYQERVLLAITEGGCSLRVEADDPSRNLRLRVLPESPACGLSHSTIRAVLKATFDQLGQQDAEQTYTTLMLGRLVASPWLSRRLIAFAGQDPRWDRGKGLPLAGDLNGYVRDALSRPEVIGLFNEMLSGSGYRVTAAQVEKVLVGHWTDVPLADKGTSYKGKMPYDAMVWLTLGKEEPQAKGKSSPKAGGQVRLRSKRSAQDRALK